GFQQHLGTTTIGIRHVQAVGAAFGREALLGDVQDPGRKRATHAGDLFVDHVADLVRDVAQLVLAAADHLAHQAHFTWHIEQFVLDLYQVAVGRTHDAADQQVVSSQEAPVAVVHLALLVRHAEHVALVDGGELAAVAQVVANDVGEVLRQYAKTRPLEGHDGDRYRVVDALADLDGELGKGKLTEQQAKADQAFQADSDHRNRSSGLNCRLKVLKLRSYIAVGRSRSS